MPEEAIVIEVDDMQVICRWPGGRVEKVLWSELRAVLIETNSLGPFGTDVFWILVGNERGCVIPAGAQGESSLLERLQQLPGFDNATLIEAMSCTDEQRFLCWKREEA